VRSSCDEIRLRFENGRRWLGGDEVVRDGTLGYRRRFWAKKLVFMATGRWALVVRRLTVTMTRGHVVCGIGRLAACESTRGRAFPSAKNQRHNQQRGELMRLPHLLCRS